MGKVYLFFAGRDPRARRGWLELDAPLQAAGAGVCLAQVLAEQGDRDAAELELSSAEALLDRIGTAS